MIAVNLKTKTYTKTTDKQSDNEIMKKEMHNKTTIRDE